MKQEIAVYGKGGIGKSTVSANLSAALALSGRKVLQIGCDPKHDSTRLLMHGERIPTVLDYLKDTEQSRASVDAVLKKGFLGIGCVEAGGPQPGVGCAGRGIISAFEFLKEHRAKDPYDIIVYDVLGDVVCGGFAVPVRREYANTIYLVTSGEYMALYAANNILRGIRNYDGDTFRRVAGIIYNVRNLEDEDGRVHRFAQAAGLPVCVRVPRSGAFARAEEQNVTVMELEGYREEQAVFRELARQINEEPERYPARPLSDEALEETILGRGGKIYAAVGNTAEALEGTEREKAPGEDRPDAGQNAGQDAGQDAGERSVGGAETVGNDVPDCASCPARPGDQDDSRPPLRPSLYGCAFNGAATVAVHLTDAVVIAHSPKACAFYTWQNISSPGRKNLFNRGILMPSAISPNFVCTDMGQPEVVFGGMDRLRDCVREAMEGRPGAEVVISSCVSGIIGDDLAAIEAMSQPEIPVIAIQADGDIVGDYMTGIRMCMRTLAEKLIDPARKPSGRRVNLVNETGVSNNLDTNYRTVKRLLDEMGISVNCRYLGDASCDEMRRFLEAPVNILAADTAEGRELRDWLISRYHCTFLEGAFPVGYQATKDWLRRLGDLFDCREQAEQVIRAEEKRWLAEIEALKPALAGKRIFMTTINTNMDWLLETADRIGMEFVGIGVINYLHQEVKITDHPEQYPIMEDFDWTEMAEAIRTLHPDILLSNYASELAQEGCVVDSMPMVPEAGFDAGIRMARRWVKLMQRRGRGKWMDDRALFEKYYT